MPNKFTKYGFSVLAIVLVSYFMTVLDVSVVITALPNIQRDLNLSTISLTWVQNAYTIIFGGLLLLGGRLGDIMGRKRIFNVILIIFGIGSLLVGLSNSANWLIIARGFQGAGAAALAPATLALLMDSIPAGEKRIRSVAKVIVEDMDEIGIKRLLFITSMGIYNEIPAPVGASGNLSSNPVLQTYRDAADIIELSDLDYTIIRPGWFDSGSDTDYQVTHKGESFGGHDVSVRSIADLVMRLAHDPQLGLHDSLGINRISK